MFNVSCGLGPVDAQRSVLVPVVGSDKYMYDGKRYKRVVYQIVDVGRDVLYFSIIG